MSVPSEKVQQGPAGFIAVKVKAADAQSAPIILHPNRLAPEECQESGAPDECITQEQLTAAHLKAY